MQSLTDEDYEVYSSVLAHFFGKHPPLRILDRTGYDWRWPELGPDYGDRRVHTILRDHPELATDFRARNREPAAVEARLPTAIVYSIESVSEGRGAWQFSRVGFSKNGHFALAMVEFVGKPGVASGMLVLCKRDDKAWCCEKISEWCS